MDKQVTDKPGGVDNPTAASYVTLMGADLVAGSITFTAANQTRSVLVTVTYPIGVVEGDYAYKLVTTGWPAGYTPGSVVNLGSEINASVSVAAQDQPPTVVISTPVDFETISVTPDQLPYAVTLNFTANVNGESPLPITGVTADVSSSPNGGGSAVTLQLTGMNTASITGAGAFPVTGPGTYYVNVSATNTAGTATDTHTFFVVVNAPPPVAIVDVPSGDPDYTWFVGSPAVVVPNSFRGETEAPTKILGFTVDLLKPIGADSNLSVTNLVGIGTATATGQVNLNFFSPDSGQYSLQVTTRNEYKTSAQATATFWINRVVGPQPVTVDAFLNASFSVAGSSNIKPGTSYLYRWERQAAGTISFVELTDDSIYSGAGTATLTITRAVYLMSGDLFRCKVGTSLNRMTASPSAALTVNRRLLTVTAASASREYGAANPTLTATITGQYPGETAEITGSANVTTGATPTSPVGGYVIVAAQGTLSAVNYTFSFVNGALNVTPKPLTASMAVSKVYDRTTTANFTGASIGLSGVLFGDPVTLNLAGASGTYADKNVGTGKTVTVTGATLSGAAAGNYTLGTVTGTGTITAKPVTSLTTVTKVYDGNTSAPAPSAANTTLSGVISPDAVSLVFTGATAVFDNPTVGTGKTVTVTGLTLAGTDAGNYSLTATGTGSITSGAGCTPGTFTFSGSSSSSGTAGNIRTFTVNGVSVKASAFSRVKPSPGGALVPAYLGIFSGGLGVTDTSEGSGSGNSHTVDNIGRDNFVLFEFSQPVVVKRAYLGYVVTDSDLTAWVGNAADPFNNHLTLSDTLLNGFIREENLSNTGRTRWATLNAGGITGNVLVVAGSLTDTTPDDQFKIGGLEICQPGGTPVTPVTLACVSNGNGTVGTAYSSHLVAAGGTPPYTYSVTNGALPGGLTLNTVTGTISGTPTAAGTFTFTAKVVDSAGTTGNSTASLNCSITIAASGGTTSRVVSGIVYLDVNRNKERNPDELPLGGITVRAYVGNRIYSTATTSANGTYSFRVAPGTYEIDAVEPKGLSQTDSDRRLVTVSSSAEEVPAIGLALYFRALDDLRADGMSHGYWKKNLSKANDGARSGMQETRTDLIAYTTTIAMLGLSPFEGVTMQRAEEILEDGDQLSLQLLAAEYNFVSGRFIDDSQAVTFAFIAWGEYVLKHRAGYSSSYRTFVKDWMDAFNNSHGDRMDGPESN